MIKSNFNLGILIIVLICCGWLMGCEKSSNQSESTINESKGFQGSVLVAVLKMEEYYSQSDKLLLTFSVHNPTYDSLSFTQYNTPFEGFLNNYLTIVDSEGNELDYHGPIAKRVMPPVKESFLTVPPNSSVSTTIDIASAYQFSKMGTFTISYSGGNISGIENGEPIQITLR